MKDMFAELRPNMTRYSSIEEVNTALIELEEHERASSTDEIEEHSDTGSQKFSSQTTTHSIAVTASGRSAANGGVEENGKGHVKLLRATRTPEASILRDMRTRKSCCLRTSPMMGQMLGGQEDIGSATIRQVGFFIMDMEEGDEMVMIDCRACFL